MARGAGVLLRARDTGRYLFLKELDGTWNVPGGHIEPAERPKEAALRELVEETGFYGRIVLSVRAARIHDSYWLYTGEVAREFEPRLSNEHVAYAWSSPLDLPRPMRSSIYHAMTARSG
jgi:8-oxo-dGTP pyrophosphatase MutT (NUDIX family)